MELDFFYKDWPNCRSALERGFPRYSFPDAPPHRGDLALALEGLAVSYDLTYAELLETLLDLMLFAPEETDPKPKDKRAAA